MMVIPKEVPTGNIIVGSTASAPNSTSKKSMDSFDISARSMENMVAQRKRFFVQNKDAADLLVDFSSAGTISITMFVVCMVRTLSFKKSPVLLSDW